MKTPDQRLIQARNIQVAKLPPWDQLIRGSLVRYYLTCGKPGCRCHRSKRFRHGPYWYVTVSVRRGKTKAYLIPTQQISQVRRAIAGYQKMWKGLCRISQINLTLLKTNQRKNHEAKSSPAK